jgi:hypothetical protein
MAKLGRNTRSCHSTKLFRTNRQNMEIFPDPSPEIRPLLPFRRGLTFIIALKSEKAAADQKAAAWLDCHLGPSFSCPGKTGAIEATSGATTPPPVAG